MSLNFCFIGAGNLATRLSQELSNNGYNIVQIYSRTEISAKTLAQKLHTNYTTSLDKIDKSADIYFVALSDAAIQPVLSQINLNNKLLVHCSGSLPLSILKKFSKNIGVFYPLQTFSQERNVDFSSIPVFIESNNKENEQVLIQLAREISNSVSVLNSQKRKRVHISAIFACNFVNHFYTLAAEVLKTENIPFDVLKPLILETAGKVQEMNPEQAQTGPAVRFDENIISAHLAALNGNKELQELYKSISKSIFDYHKKSD